MSELFDMLRYRRPAGSITERIFIERYILTLPGVESDYCKPFSNWHVQVGTSRVLWSCHTDTVHYTDGIQLVKYTKNDFIKLHKRERISNCLGADDTAGVYLLRQMILRGVPGHYVFHGCEEHGGKGSQALAMEHGSWLRDSFDYAIALDRAGCGDIITHQAGGRTSSDLFAYSLADSLVGYQPCPYGMYTDTAEYADLIAECTNLSVGYEHAHTPREVLDVNHVDSLLDDLVSFDESTLSVARRPGEDDPPFVPSGWSAVLSDPWLDDTTTVDLPEDAIDARTYLYPEYFELATYIKKGGR